MVVFTRILQIWSKRIRDAALLASFSSITFAAKKQKSQNNDSSRTI